ncbi:hypothetical protein [Frigoribacterium sp. VKM Ac-2836]|uniref:hypothetical protein n=1 Tax=Frigoribacterium sp. VKM Ac-2836 TaxID=2739014 RepID=UPI001562FBB9|nr:hypothetical protein [Frigoribacterium sp. VKM Ac-2836]NRD26644.1 hypothetical protein [Frigoribacterium sp. VKM Ac-2836]
MNISITHDDAWRLVHDRHSPQSIDLSHGQGLQGAEALAASLADFDFALARIDASAGLIGWAALVIVQNEEEICCPHLDARGRGRRTDRPDHGHPSTAMGPACRTENVRVLGPGLEPTSCAAVTRVTWSWVVPDADGARQVVLLVTECPHPQPADLVVPEVDDMARLLQISTSA